LRAHLRRLGGPAGDGDVSARDERSDEERGGVREVGLDVDVDGAYRPRGDLPATGLGNCHLDTPRAERRDRHLDVGQARQSLARMPEIEPALEPRCREEQARDELARRGCVEFEGTAFDAPGAVNGEGEGRASVVVEVDAESSQAQDRAAHRAAARALVAVEGGGSEGECGDRREEPHHGAGKAAVDRGGSEQLVSRDDA
jgi:hypothetical protein